MRGLSNRRETFIFPEVGRRLYSNKNSVNSNKKALATRETIQTRTYAKTTGNNTNYASSRKAQIGVEDLRVDNVRNEDEGRCPKPHEQARKAKGRGQWLGLSSQKVPEGRVVTTTETVPGYPYAIFD